MKKIVVGAFLLAISGCYSFKGISIDPNVKTFFVQNFSLNPSATNVPPTLAVDFTERLKDKIRTETRLVLQNTEPHVEFSGEIADFRVVPIAPKPGELVALNRLEIRISVGLNNTVIPKDSWPNQRTFSFFAEFPSDRDLLTVQETLVTQITDQLLEDIFNAAFNNW